MSTPNEPSDQNPQSSSGGEFAAPGGTGGSPTPPPPSFPSGGAQPFGNPSYGSQPPGGQPPYGGQPYGGQPGYGGGQPPYGSPSGGSGAGPTANKFGLAALIVGGVSLILSFIPIVNYVSGVLALVGLVLGIVGLVIKNRPRGLAIAGVIVSALALVLSIVLAIVYTVGFATTVVGEISEQIPDSSSFPTDAATPDEDERTVEVVYEITGDGTDVTIVYLSVTAAESGSDIETLTEQTLPWTEEFDATVGGEFDYSTFNVTATNGAEDEGEIACSITVDGEVVAEDTADGAFGIVSCTSSDVG
jgi:hypothetical protein